MLRTESQHEVEGLQLPQKSIHHWIEEWFYYIAAGSFHIKKFCSRLYSIELELYSQQVAQLWQRDRAKLDIRFRLTCSVIRKIMHKIEFLGHPMGHQEQYKHLI